MLLRRSRRSDDLHINLTPLIDTVFLLLTFFLMTTTFNTKSVLKIDLPEASTEDKSIESIRVIINEKGEYAIDDAEHKLVDKQLATLKQALKKAMDARKIADNSEEKNKLSVLISADKNTPHQAVVTAMEAAREVDLINLAFEAQHITK